MAFNVAPKVIVFLALLLIFVFAFPVESSSWEQQKRIVKITGYFPVEDLGSEIFSFTGGPITALPNSNSATKGTWRGAIVKLGPNNYFKVGEVSNVTDDSGNRYTGAFTLLGPFMNSNPSDPSGIVGRLKVASGNGDFYNATGNDYIKMYSESTYQDNLKVKIRASY